MGTIDYEHVLRVSAPHDLYILDDKVLILEDSLKHVNHSPTGFSYGYGGSGPAQLSAAIMLELTGSVSGHQQFKWGVISQLDRDRNEFTILFNLSGEWRYAKDNEI
jgi:hypothetical protein